MRTAHDARAHEKACRRPLATYLPPPTVTDAGQLTTEYAPLLRFMLAPACSPYASAQAQLHVGITGDQWQSVAELTNYGRGQEMPRYAPWSVLQSAPARAVTASTPTADIDEIEED